MGERIRPTWLLPLHLSHIQGLENRTRAQILAPNLLFFLTKNVCPPCVPTSPTLNPSAARANTTPCFPPVSILIPSLSLEDGLLFCGYHQPVLNSTEAPLAPLSQTTRNFIRQQQPLFHPGSREEEMRCSKTSDLGTALGMIMWSHLNGSQFNV